VDLQIAVIYKPDRRLVASDLSLKNRVAPDERVGVVGQLGFVLKVRMVRAVGVVPQGLAIDRRRRIAWVRFWSGRPGTGA